jgi:hypothetical protein
MFTVRAAVLTIAVGALLSTSACKKKEDEAPPAGAGGAAVANKPPTPVATVTHAPPNPANNEADAAAVRNCCSALRSAAGSQKSPADKSKFESAAASCDGIAVLVKNGTSQRSAAMGSVRAALRGETPPAACN